MRPGPGTLWSILTSAPSVLGIRAGTEEPRHTTTALGAGVEIRSYGPRLAACTVVEGDEDAARSAGFRRLAGYIFGGNGGRPGAAADAGARIAMTAPVAQEPSRGGDRDGTRIAMTAPVAQAGAGGSWEIRFFLPAAWSARGLAALPVPDDERVTLEEVPAADVAVLRFSGDRGPAAVARRTAELTAVLNARGLTITGAPAAWFYDPPWTLPPLRRNEIAIPVARESAAGGNASGVS